MAERLTARTEDGIPYVRSETGAEGVGYSTTQRRLPELMVKLAAYEDAEEKGGWISVKDRLPKAETEVRIRRNSKMPDFIEVTDQSNQNHFVNVNEIRKVIGNCIYLRSAPNVVTACITCLETYEEVKRKIKGEWR